MNVLLLLSLDPNVPDPRNIDGICKHYNPPEGLQPFAGLRLDEDKLVDFPHEIVVTRVLPSDFEGHGTRIVAFVQPLDKRWRKKWEMTRATLLSIGWQRYRKADREKAAKPLAA